MAREPGAGELRLIPSAVVALATNDGAVVSMLICSIDALALLPALSNATPVTIWSVPSLTVTGAGQMLIPDSASSQAKVTVTA